VPRRNIKAPPLRLAALEALAPFEFAGIVASWTALPLARRGDESAVLVIPALGGTDASTRVLRRALRSRGFWPHRTGIPGIGIATSLDQLRRRLDQLSAAHHDKVSVVGWSLGGIYARELARERPDSVRQVITLASPFRHRTGDRAIFSPLLPARLRDRDPFLHLNPEHHRDPVPVRATAIYTRTDGVVRWHSCIEEASPMSENIEVRATHVGMVVNPAVIFAVIDRLAQPDDGWQPFRPPTPLIPFFPQPTNWRSDGGVTRRSLVLAR
jgi:pimeloyl-ACP methyl ester carboxylesterase